MKGKIFKIFILILGSVGFFQGCAGTKVKKTFVPGPMPPGGSFTGTWWSNWGKMELTQSGNSVSGTYKDESKDIEGKIEGTVEGNILRFSWSQRRRSVRGVKAITGKGIFQLFKDESGQYRLRGTWGYGDETGPYKWNAYLSRKSRRIEEGKEIEELPPPEPYKYESEEELGY
jgi:hypothetical protein